MKRVGSGQDSRSKKCLGKIYLHQIPQEQITRPQASLEDKVMLDSKLAQKIINYLSLQLKKKVDLLSYKGINPLLRKRILNEEVRII